MGRGNPPLAVRSLEKRYYQQPAVGWVVSPPQLVNLIVSISAFRVFMASVRGGQNSMICTAGRDLSIPMVIGVYESLYG